MLCQRSLGHFSQPQLPKRMAATDHWVGAWTFSCPMTSTCGLFMFQASTTKLLTSYLAVFSTRHNTSDLFSRFPHTSLPRRSWRLTNHERFRFAPKETARLFLVMRFTGGLALILCHLLPCPLLQTRVHFSPQFLPQVHARTHRSLPCPLSS